MVQNALLAMFMALFAITAPIVAVPLFVAATEGQSEPERRRTALIAAATYVFAGLVALFAGNAALSFFGVSVAALHLVGMAVLAVIGWQIINAPTAIAEPVGPEGAARLHAASNTRIDRPGGRRTPTPLSIGVTPLGFPSYAGPSVLSVIIAWGSGSEPIYPIAVIAILANAALLLALNFLATPITSIIGAEALLVTETLFGLIVVAIAVGGIASALLILFPGLQAHQP